MSKDDDRRERASAERVNTLRRELRTHEVFHGCEFSLDCELDRSLMREYVDAFYAHRDQGFDRSLIDEEDEKDVSTD